MTESTAIKDPHLWVSFCFWGLTSFLYVKLLNAQISINMYIVILSAKNTDTNYNYHNIKVKH